MFQCTSNILLIILSFKSSYSSSENSQSTSAGASKTALASSTAAKYVLGVSSKLVSQWEAYFKIHPEYMAAVEEAKAVLLAPADVDCEFSEDEYDDLKDRIISSIFDVH